MDSGLLIIKPLIVNLCQNSTPLALLKVLLTSRQNTDLVKGQRPGGSFFFDKKEAMSKFIDYISILVKYKIGQLVFKKRNVDSVFLKY